MERVRMMENVNDGKDFCNLSSCLVGKIKSWKDG